MKSNTICIGVIIAIFLTIYSCKKENTNTDSNSAIALGKSYGGGIIFYIDGTGQHGLIAASADQSRLIPWYNGTHILTNVKNTAVGVGQANTTAIISKQGVGNYAASLCDELVLNGYSDWFLPSKEELNLLYQQRDQVGGFTTNYYWTSVEYDTIKAWNQYFPFGPQFYADKADSACVRAIRAF